MDKTRTPTRRQGLPITQVKAGSIAEELNISPGDRLVSINGRAIKDLLDYRFFEGEETLLIEVSKANGEVWEVDIEKDLDEDLGIEPEEMKIRQCPNKCLFCFVDQMPEGQRGALYIRDEDYRFSFLFGNYITLTNLTRRDKARIFEQKMSPLYISVHTTDPALRRQLLENPRARNILEEIEEMAEHKIVMHTQIVLCPDLNDGDYLTRSVKDLAERYPSVESLAIVPVGLTRHRKGLPEVTEVDASYARALLSKVQSWQAQFQSSLGVPFVFAADEWFVIGDVPFPPLTAYGELQQLENGVGMLPLFLEQFGQSDLFSSESLPHHAGELEDSPAESLQFLIATSTSFAPYLASCLEKIQLSGVVLTVITVVNQFFGDSVTVAGLLTAGDIIQAIQLEDGFRRAPGSNPILLIPSVSLDEEKAHFLDGRTLVDIESALDIPTHIVPSDAPGFLAALKALIESPFEFEKELEVLGNPLQIVGKHPDLCDLR